METQNRTTRDAGWIFAAATLATVFAAALPADANADNGGKRGRQEYGYGRPHWDHHRGVWISSAPVYVQPAPAYVPPPRVIYVPRPVYAPPVYAPPVYAPGPSLNLVFPLSFN